MNRKIPKSLLLKERDKAISKTFPIPIPESQEFHRG